MGPIVEKWMTSASTSVLKSIVEKWSKSKCEDEFKKVVRAKIPYANIRETAFLVDACFAYQKTAMNWKRANPNATDDALIVAMTRPFSIRAMEHAANQMDKKLQVKAKTIQTTQTLNYGRENSIVFYLSSAHQTPAKDHKNYQGKLYVDRFWKTTLESQHMDAYIPAVRKYIEDKKLHTVQWSMGAPVYLVTRPYCRHYFVPISLGEVLSGESERDMLAVHPEAHMPNHRTMTDKVRYQKYLARRALIRQKMRKAV